MSVSRTVARLFRLTASVGSTGQHRARPVQHSTMEHPLLFKGEKDRFSGITVSSSLEPAPSTEFESILTASLDHWSSEKVRGVWFKVDLQNAAWVPVLAKHGFVYHHAQSEFVTMVRWLALDEPNNIPRYAHNVVGVGAFVVNAEDELLVVRERFHTRPHWKLPGGYVEPGEDLSQAAIREVREETGVEAEFESLVSFRHVHGASFGCSDIYFIVHLRPRTQAITMCPNELAACQWMKIGEYLQHPYVHETNRYFAERFLECRQQGVQVTATKLYSPGWNKHQHIYSIDFSKTSRTSDQPVLNVCTNSAEDSTKNSNIPVAKESSDVSSSNSDNKSSEVSNNETNKNLKLNGVEKA